MKSPIKAQDTSFQPAFDGVRSLSGGCATGSSGGQARCAGRLHGCLGKRFDLEVGSVVLSGEAPSRHVWFVRSGILRLQRYGYTGRRQVLSLILPGETIGYEAQLREGMSVDAATPCNVCRIDKRDFDLMLERDSDLRKDFLLQQQRQLDRLLWLTWSIGALRPDERFSAFLVLASRFMPYQVQPDGSGILSMRLSRPDIADLLSTTVETISRITHRLAHTGIIEIVDPANFRIRDMKKLSKLGRIGSGFDGFPKGPDPQNTRLNVLLGLVDAQPDGVSRVMTAVNERRQITPYASDQSRSTKGGNVTWLTRAPVLK
ncbi:MAG: hypothetical protein C0524_06850 [Rhodobacter sp.]|nr:hypothetical protein [Rhodobacter sp.]